MNHWGVFIAFFFGCILHAQTLELRYELPRQVKANQVSSLYKDPAGSVFLGTDRGLFSFDDRDWKGFSLPDSLKNKRISAITSFHRNLIIGLDNGRLLLFDGFSFDLYSPKNLSLSHSVRKLLLSKNQDLLIATYGDGLHILHADSSVTHYSRKQGLPSEDIYDVSFSPQDHICVATDQGLVRITPSSAPQVILPSDLILHLNHPQPRDASILALDYDGHLFSIDTTTVDTLFSTSSSTRGLVSNTTGDVFIVNSDTIWKASGPGYASATPIMLNATDVWEKVWMDEQNQLWLINSNDQLVVVPTHLQKFQPLTSPIQCISAVDSILFLGTESGLYAYHPSTDSVLYHLLPEYNLLDLEWFPERQELWCASFGQGIIILDKNQLRVERLTEAEGLINDNLLSLHVQDSIVLAATLGGLSLLDVSTHRPLYHLYDSIPQSQYIYDAAIDEQGILWLAKDRRGLLRLDQEGKITSFFGKSTIYHLMLDSIGLYAATSGSGVRYIERNTLDSFHFLGDRSCLAVAMDTFGHRYFFSEDGIHIHQPDNQHSVPFYPQYTSEEAYLFSHAYDLDAYSNLWWAQ